VKIFFQKSRGHVKILRARKVILSKFRTEQPQIRGASEHNADARATWHPGIVHFWRRMQKPNFYRDAIFNS